MSGLKRRISVRCKMLLARLLPDSQRLRYLAQLPQLDRWRREHRPGLRLFRTRVELYEYVNSELLRNAPIEFLEFGVYRGESIRCWSAINSNAASQFVGFDSFAGLPESWRHFTETSARGLYDTGGAVPRLDDERVRFVKGLFQETLPGYLESRSHRPQRRVVHLDADLYSSTLFVLTRCNEILTPGAIVLFDEFSAVLHEFRALADYCAAYRRGYVLLAATRSPTSLFDQIAIRMEG